VSSGRAEELIQRARELAPLAAACAAESERLGRLPDSLVEALRQSSLFNLLVPRELGGPEADVPTLVEAIEAVSAGDGAAGWCVMIAATTSSVAATIPRRGAEEIFGDPRVATGGTLVPPGRARRSDGGFVADGKWAFGSGSSHADWMLSDFIVEGADGPEMLAENLPHRRRMLIPRREVIVHDTWHVSGLRGTSSDDWEVRQVLVPEHHTASLLDRPWAAGTLYRFPLFGVLALGVASVALGIARAAITELTALATAKTPTGSRRALAERAAAQSGVAEAEALVRSGRIFMLDTIRDVWRRVERGEKATVEHRTLLRLSATTAALHSARAVDICYNLGGGTSIYETSPLQREFRDIHTLTQHVMVGQPTLEVAGRVLLGVPTDTTMF
jgi:alkylation response protein AidB-like acyl-CoA dehydrogenase